MFSYYVIGIIALGLILTGIAITTILKTEELDLADRYTYELPTLAKVSCTFKLTSKLKSITPLLSLSAKASPDASQTKPDSVSFQLKDDSLSIHKGTGGRQDLYTKVDVGSPLTLVIDFSKDEYSANDGATHSGFISQLGSHTKLTFGKTPGVTLTKLKVGNDKVKLSTLKKKKE